MGAIHLGPKEDGHPRGTAGLQCPGGSMLVKARHALSPSIAPQANKVKRSMSPSTLGEA